MISVDTFISSLLYLIYCYTVPISIYRMMLSHQLFRFDVDLASKIAIYCLVVNKCYLHYCIV